TAGCAICSSRSRSPPARPRRRTASPIPSMRRSAATRRSPTPPRGKSFSLREVFMRKTVVALVCALAGTAHGDEIKVGIAGALSGPAGALGQGMKAGIEAYFARVNAAGGVGGRPLRLVARDDGYEPARAGTNVRELIEKDGVFALLGNPGTPTAAVAVPIANAHHVPFFGAFTGAGLLRKTPPDRYVINFRASYAQETKEMVRGLVED